MIANRPLLAGIFPRLTPVTYFTLFMSVVIGQSNNFGFDFTTPNRKLFWYEYHAKNIFPLACSGKQDIFVLMHIKIS